MSTMSNCCASCGKASPSRPCNKGCGMVVYCDRKCQKAHFRFHKTECQKACQGGSTVMNEMVAAPKPSVGMQSIIPATSVPSGAVQRRQVAMDGLFDKWESARRWYQQTMVLHYNAKQVPPECIRKFVGVYTPCDDMAMPFPFCRWDDTTTSALFDVFEHFPVKEKLHRREHGLWLNARDYSSLADPSYVTMRLGEDFSIQVEQNGENMLLVRVAKHPSRLVTAYIDKCDAKLATDTQKPVAFFHDNMEDTFDEWKLLDSNSKVMGTATLALTPLSIFLMPIFPNILSTREWLCRERVLILWTTPQSDQEESSNQTLPPPNWLSTVLGVYKSTETGFVHGNLSGSHRGWERDLFMTRECFGSLPEVDTATERSLCLYSCNSSNQLVVRQSNGYGRVREDYPPELTSTQLPPRRKFENDEGEIVASNWTAHLTGLGEWIIPLVLFSSDPIMSELRHGSFSIEEATKAVLRRQASTPGGPLDRTSRSNSWDTEPVPEPAGEKKKRKRRKKKKKDIHNESLSYPPATLENEPLPLDSSMQQSLSVSNAVQPDWDQQLAAASAKGGTSDESRALSVQSQVYPGSPMISSHSAVGMHFESKTSSTRPQGLRTDPNIGMPQSSSNQPKSGDIATTSEKFGDSIDASEKVLQVRDAPATVARNTSVENICRWLGDEIASRATAVPHSDLGLLGFDKLVSICNVVQWLFDPHLEDDGESLWVHANDSMTAALLQTFLDPVDHQQDEVVTASRWLQQNGMRLLQVCVERSRMRDVIALLGSRKTVPVVTASMACQVFGKLQTAKGGTEIGNAVARQIVEVQLDSMSESKEVHASAGSKLSKDAFAALKGAVRRGEIALKKRQLLDPAPSIENICDWLNDEIASKAPCIPHKDLDLLGFEKARSICNVAQWMFDPYLGDDELLWVHAEDSMTAPLLDSFLGTADHHQGDLESMKQWLQKNGAHILQICVDKGRMKDVVALIASRKTVPLVSASMACRIFGKLQTSKGGTELGNTLAKRIPLVQLDAISDSKAVQKCAANKLSKKASDALKTALRKGERDLRKREKEAKRKSEKKHVSTLVDTSEPKIEEETNDSGEHGMMEQSIATMRIKEDLSGCQRRIDNSVQWYIDELERLQRAGTDSEVGTHQESTDNALPSSHSLLQAKVSPTSNVQSLTSDQIARAMDSCDNLPEEKAEEVLSDVEMSLDLSNWSISSVWVVEITEQAHKWFQKRSKKQHHLCERVLRRMHLLSTGRWPYVLCKPVRTSRKASINLYESKIDAASRILWEVAVSFSPRRSSKDNFYSEQVIRVWDIVEDHDNLTRAIDRAVERIEKSHLRGRECMIYSQLVDVDDDTSVRHGNVGRSDGTQQRIPRVFGMKQANKGQGDEKQRKVGVYYAPANDDEKQFNLLKFYEMNADAVALLLADETDNTDLPFTPGPLEHKIIHHHPSPKSSILLMGRSGTGKTTCLVFRMWAEYMAVKDKQLRQLFLTKNDVLRTEVKRSFSSMGLAWRKRVSQDINGNEVQHFAPTGANTGDISGPQFPLFLTSAEWLDILDNELPGQCFFTKEEMKQRLGSRGEDDAVQRGMEEFFGSGKNPQNDRVQLARREMTFGRFCKLWPKINSSLKTTMDPALVWLEIKSHIKGCVAALNLGEQNLYSTNRFLSRDQYLALPRKQSRVDQRLRKLIYDLFLHYERVKKGKYYDDMDIVHNLAKRVPSRGDLGAKLRRLFPVDAVFIDEVQDFTQSELYLVAKLCNDPNSLMLAGDTAQSIAVGVGFRFTDVRQMFFNSFGGIEPELLKLTHNYRSHSGILQLAASVVELLYSFFPESLDKLPPDFGLFAGPKPVLMEVSSVSDLVLMLDGSKRETSRIEFGAHQVVIVRNEEAKKSLPDEFGVDKDWVMTVQESKGLEFDDVLLLNFFGDSPAGDSWRVVSNYSEEEANSYRGDCTADSSSLHPLNWDEIEARHHTRHLDFDHESHKILETELKMLYTAITRARVNVFIAEMDVSSCQPMFNYFRQRRLVESIQKDDAKELSGVRVFGQINTVEEWKKRGQYYLQKTVGQKENVGTLRLAAKCFEKAGETKKMRHALAYVDFLKLEAKEAVAVGKNRGQGMERKRRLYSIAADLLESEDIEFLSTAGLCLMRTGTDYGRSAKILEVHARIRYVTRLANEHIRDGRPSHHEQQQFSYASQLYERCLSDKGSKVEEKRVMLVNAFRCCMSSGKENDLERATRLLEDHSEYCRNIFLDIASIWHGSESEFSNPSKDWISCLHRESEAFEHVKKAMVKIAFIACRSLYTKNDQRGLTTAVSVVPSRKERIQLLSSLDNDADYIARTTPWGYAHPAFGCSGKEKKTAKSADSTNLLCLELTSDGDFDAAADVLEARGRLLEAAECLSKTPGMTKIDRIFKFKVLYAELIVGSRHGKSKPVETKSLPKLLQSLQEDFEESGTSLSFDAKMAFVMSKANFSESENDLYQVWEMSRKAPILWKLEGTQLVMDSKKSVVEVNDKRKGIWDRSVFILLISRELRTLIEALSSASQEGLPLLSQAYSFFQLRPCPSDPRSLLTNVVTNWRLRTALQTTEEELPVSSTFDSDGLTVAIDKSKVHSILAQYCCDLGVEFLQNFDATLTDEAVDFEICPFLLRSQDCNCNRQHLKRRERLVANYSDYLQSRISCLHEMKCLSELGKKRCSGSNSRWISLLSKLKRNQTSCTRELVNTIHTFIDVPILIMEDIESEPSFDSIVIREKPILTSLLIFSLRLWNGLSLGTKKFCLVQTIKLWRILDICKKDDEECKRILDKKLEAGENLRDAQKDFYQRRLGHFIRSEIEVVAGEVKKVRLLFRQWLWAVQSAKENIFESVALAGNLLKVTCERKFFETLPRSYQLSLLETNCITLFSLISYRYTDVSSKKLWLALPETRYMRFHLLGESSNQRTLGRGFGIRLIDTLKCIDERDLFFNFFAKFVAHLEALASLVIECDLLSSTKKMVAEESESLASIHCLERAVVLCSCIAFNSLALSNAGRIMSMADASREPNVLPRLPIGGNIRGVIIHLRDALVELQHVRQAPSRLQVLARGVNRSSSLIDVFKVAQGILEEAFSDRFLVFRIGRDKDSIAMQRNEAGPIQWAKEVWLEFEARNTSLASESRGKGDGLNYVLLSDPFPCQEFLLHASQQQQDESVEVEMHGIQDLSYAAMTIQRCFRSRKSSTSRESYFRLWKRRMTVFARLLKRRIDSRHGNTLEIQESPSVDEQSTNPLGSVPNLYGRLSIVADSKETWRNWLKYHMPFYDGVQCEYCQCFFDIDTFHKRQMWWKAEYPYLDYKAAAQSFNLAFYQTQWLSSSNMSRHVLLEEHKRVQEIVFHLLEELPSLFSRVEISLKMLEATINVCEKEIARGESNKSWYLICEQESRSQHAEVGFFFTQMRDLYFHKQFDQLMAAMARFRDQSFRPQSFLEQKRDQEKQFMLEQTRVASEEDLDNSDNDNGDDIDEYGYDTIVGPQTRKQNRF